jgi:hypothetical protein
MAFSLADEPVRIELMTSLLSLTKGVPTIDIAGFFVFDANSQPILNRACSAALLVSAIGIGSTLGRFSRDGLKNSLFSRLFVFKEALKAPCVTTCE